MSDKQTRPGLYISRDGDKIQSIWIEGNVPEYDSKYLAEIAQDLRNGKKTISEIKKRLS